MSDNQSNNKRIAKNTIMLYVRMLLSILVSLYTSRVVLQTLGVEDYGIYGVVGGVVAMFSFLNAAMSGATSRFLSFELGKSNSNQDCDENSLDIGNKQSAKESILTPLQKTFSSAMIIHIGIALTIFVLSITIGLWFLNNKLVIPENRMTAAYWLFVGSIIGMFLKVTQVPYSAAMISHEKMDVYAYVELLHVFLKLGIVYCLLIVNIDKLILYAFLVLAVDIIIAMTYRLYCVRKFKETHFHLVFEKSIIMPMLSFSFWNLYANLCFSFRQQGNNFLINMFFGVILNAASTITTTIYGIVIGLGSNVIQAIRPQIVKAYAQNNIEYMQSLMHNASKYAVVLLGYIIVPAILEMPCVLDIWLGEVPPFAATFCRILLITAPLVMLSNTLMIGVHATGKIRNYSVFTGTLYMISIPIAYVVLRMGGNEISTYVVSICTTTVVLISNLLVLKNQVKSFSPIHYLYNVCVAAIVIAITGAVVYFVRSLLDVGFMRIVVITLTNALILSILTFVFVLDTKTKGLVLKKMKIPCNKYQ